MRIKHLFFFFLLLPLLVSCQNQAHNVINQFDYLAANISLFATLPSNALQNPVLCVPANLRYTDATYEAYLTDLFATYPETVIISNRPTSYEDTICFYYTLTEDDAVLASHSPSDGDGLELSLSGIDFLSIEGFNKQLVGVCCGTSLTFSINVPATHSVQEWAGKTVTAHVTVSGIRETRIPTSLSAEYILHTLGQTYEQTNPDDVISAFEEEVQTTLRTYCEENLAHALEEAVLSHLLSSCIIHSFPQHDLSYNLAALYNYYESLRTYENEILSLCGAQSDVSASLGAYLARTYDLENSLDGYVVLVEEALSLTHTNIAVAAAFHALNLSISEEEVQDYCNMFTAANGHSPLDSLYVRNALLYEKTIDCLLSSPYTLIYEEDAK